MMLSATGHNASIDLFENHLVITRAGRGIFFPGPEQEQFVPISSIKSVQFRRPTPGSRGRIVLTLLGGHGGPIDGDAILFSKSQLARFEAVLHAIQGAIATPSIERLALEAQRHRVTHADAHRPIRRVDEPSRAFHRGEDVGGVGSHHAYQSRSHVGDRNSSVSLSGWWKGVHLPGKICVVGIAALPLAAIISGFSHDPEISVSETSKLERTDNTNQSSSISSYDKQDSAASLEKIRTDTTLPVGSWILTPKGGEDGRTRCVDFAAASLYGLNGNTAKIMTFDSDGHYRDVFAYTTPSGEEHYTKSAASWKLGSGKIIFNDFNSRDAYESQEDSTSFVTISSSEDNVIYLGDSPSDRFVRCIGSISAIYGE